MPAAAAGVIIPPITTAVTRTIRDLATALAGRAAAADPEQAARIDRALMHVSRALVPIDYTTGDRFAHDPALPEPPWASLQPVRALVATADRTDTAHFQMVDAIRARNRVLHALRRANGVLERV